MTDTRCELDLGGAGAVDTDTAELTSIGNATVLLRAGGFTILTDPNFLHAGERAYLGMGLTSKRLKEPALSIEDLPPLDFVVLSHHHGDHFDRVAAAGLDKDLPILTEPHSARKLARQGFRRVVALDTWEAQTVRRGDASVRVTAMPGKHSPRALGFAVPPVMGSLLEFAGPRRVYVTGDTLLHDRLHEIPRRHPDIDVCLIHLGATKVAGILLTMDAEQGVETLRIVRPRTAVPIHYEDYTVFSEGLDAFRARVAEADLPTVVEYVGRGETWRLPA